MSGFTTTSFTVFDFLLFSSFTVLFLWLVGIVVFYVFTSCVFRHSEAYVLQLVDTVGFASTVFLFVGVGTIGLISTMSVLLFVPGTFPLKVLVTTFLYGVTGFVLSIRLLWREKRSLVDTLTHIGTRKVVFLGIVCALLGYAFYHFIHPLRGLYGYPGTDDIIYAFASKKIIEHGRFPLLGFTYPFSYLDIHLIALGMPIFASFFSSLFNLNLATTYLFIIQFSRGLTPLFVYSVTHLLLKKTTKRLRRFGSLGALVVSTFSIAQYMFFTWGGWAKFRLYCCVNSACYLSASSL